MISLVSLFAGGLVTTSGKFTLRYIIMTKSALVNGKHRNFKESQKIVRIKDKDRPKNRFRSFRACLKSIITVHVSMFSK